MSGTKAGARKAVETIKTKYGDDFFVVQGAKGGREGHTGGFYANRELASVAGRKGGTISKRGKAGYNNHREFMQEAVIASHKITQPAEERPRYIKPSLWASVKARIRTHGR